MIKAIASACLIGLKTRYDGGSNPDPEIVEMFKKGGIIPLCPEQLGGLPTPREPFEFVDGDGEALLEGKATLKGLKTGKDGSEFFIRGAEQVVAVVRLLGVKKAYLKEGSPSCGVNWVHIDGKVVHGCGVTAALLKRLGIELEGRLPPSSVTGK